MSRETENALLLLMGLAVAMITIGGAFTRYVKPSLLVWLIITAVVLVGLALTAIVGDLRRGGPLDHEHGGHVHRGAVGWLLVVPVVVLIFITPPALRPEAASPTVTAVSTQVLRRPFPPLPSGHAPELRLPEVVIRSAQDTAGTLNNRLIAVVGFTLNESDGLDLGRVVIICCAADAQLARIHLRGGAALSQAGDPEYTWLRVEGIVRTGEGNGDSTSTPTMDVAQAVSIPAPSNTYA